MQKDRIYNILQRINETSAEIQLYCTGKGPTTTCRHTAIDINIKKICKKIAVKGPISYKLDSV